MQHFTLPITDEKPPTLVGATIVHGVIGDHFIAGHARDNVWHIVRNFSFPRGVDLPSRRRDDSADRLWHEAKVMLEATKTPFEIIFRWPDRYEEPEDEDGDEKFLPPLYGRFAST